METPGHQREHSIAAALQIARRRRADGEGFFEGGPVHAAVPGRTDRLPLHVPSGSYVIPADIVSGVGEGNTAAGARIFDALFRKYAGRAKGGRTDPNPTPVIVAGGEYIVPPHAVEEVGGGNIERGHAILDSFVKEQRKRLINTLRKLPGPAKD